MVDDSPPEPFSPLVRKSRSRAVNGSIVPARPVYKNRRNSTKASMHAIGSNCNDHDNNQHHNDHHDPDDITCEASQHEGQGSVFLS